MSSGSYDLESRRSKTFSPNPRHSGTFRKLTEEELEIQYNPGAKTNSSDGAMQESLETESPTQTFSERPIGVDFSPTTDITVQKSKSPIEVRTDQSWEQHEKAASRSLSLEETDTPRQRKPHHNKSKSLDSKSKSDAGDKTKKHSGFFDYIAKSLKKRHSSTSDKQDNRKRMKRKNSRHSSSSSGSENDENGSHRRRKGNGNTEMYEVKPDSQLRPQADKKQFDDLDQVTALIIGNTHQRNTQYNLDEVASVVVGGTGKKAPSPGKQEICDSVETLHDSANDENLPDTSVKYTNFSTPMNVDLEMYDQVKVDDEDDGGATCDTLSDGSDVIVDYAIQNVGAEHNDALSPETSRVQEYKRQVLECVAVGDENSPEQRQHNDSVSSSSSSSSSSHSHQMNVSNEVPCPPKLKTFKLEATVVIDPEEELEENVVTYFGPVYLSPQKDSDGECVNFVVVPGSDPALRSPTVSEEDKIPSKRKQQKTEEPIMSTPVFAPITSIVDAHESTTSSSTDEGPPPLPVTSLAQVIDGQMACESEPARGKGENGECVEHTDTHMKSEANHLQITPPTADICKTERSPDSGTVAQVESPNYGETNSVLVHKPVPKKRQRGKIPKTEQRITKDSNSNSSSPSSSSSERSDEEKSRQKEKLTSRFENEDAEDSETSKPMDASGRGIAVHIRPDGKRVELLDPQKFLVKTKEPKQKVIDLSQAVKIPVASVGTLHPETKHETLTSEAVTTASEKGFDENQATYFQPSQAYLAPVHEEIIFPYESTDEKIERNFDTDSVPYPEDEITKIEIIQRKGLVYEMEHAGQETTSPPESDLNVCVNDITDGRSDTSDTIEPIKAPDLHVKHVHELNLPETNIGNGKQKSPSKFCRSSSSSSSENGSESFHEKSKDSSRDSKSSKADSSTCSDKLYVSRGQENGDGLVEEVREETTKNDIFENGNMEDYEQNSATQSQISGDKSLPRDTEDDNICLTADTSIAIESIPEGGHANHHDNVNGNEVHCECDGVKSVTSEKDTLHDSTTSSSSSSKQIEVSSEKLPEPKEVDICICQPEQTTQCENDNWEAVEDALKNAAQCQPPNEVIAENVSNSEQIANQSSHSNNPLVTTASSISENVPGGYLPQMSDGMEPDESVKPWVPVSQGVSPENPGKQSLVNDTSESLKNLSPASSCEHLQREDKVRKSSSSSSSSSSSTAQSGKDNKVEEEINTPREVNEKEISIATKHEGEVTEETLQKDDVKIDEQNDKRMKSKSSPASESLHTEETTIATSISSPADIQKYLPPSVLQKQEKSVDNPSDQDISLTSQISSGIGEKNERESKKKEKSPTKNKTPKPSKTEKESTKPVPDDKSKGKDSMNTSTSSGTSSGDSSPSKKKSKLFSWPFKWHKKKDEDKNTESDKDAPKSPGSSTTAEPMLPRTSTPLESPSLSAPSASEDEYHERAQSCPEADSSVQSAPTTKRHKDRSMSANSSSSSSSSKNSEKESKRRKSSSGSGTSTPKAKRAVSPDGKLNTTLTTQEIELPHDQTTSVNSSISCPTDTQKQQSYIEHHTSRSRSSSRSSIDQSELSALSKEPQAFEDPLLANAAQCSKVDGKKQKKKAEKPSETKKHKPDSGTATSKSEISDLDTSIASDAYSQNKKEKRKKEKKKEKEQDTETENKEKEKKSKEKAIKDKARKQTTDKQKEDKETDKREKDVKLKKKPETENENQSKDISKKKRAVSSKLESKTDVEEDTKKREKNEKEKINDKKDKPKLDKSAESHQHKAPESKPQKPRREKTERQDSREDGEIKRHGHSGGIGNKDTERDEKPRKEKPKVNDEAKKRTEEKDENKEMKRKDVKKPISETEEREKMRRRKESTDKVKSEPKRLDTHKRSSSHSSSSSSSSKSEGDDSKALEEKVTEKKDPEPAKKTKKKPCELPMQPPAHQILTQSSPPQESNAVIHESIELTVHTHNEISAEMSDTAPVRPPRTPKSPISEKFQKFLPSLRSSTKKDAEKQSGEKLGDPRHFDGQYHREDDVTQDVPEDVTKRVKKKRTPSEREELQYADAYDADTPLDPPIYSQPRHFVVVAIDFGTTHSGYAFSFIRDPNSVYMMRRWAGEEPGVVNQKTLTSLLLTPEGEFHSFGYSARSNYLNLVPLEARHWMYFSTFKMELHHNADLNRETLLVASNGAKFSALKVFAFSLEFFKNHALQQLSDQSGTELLNEDIRWVITVPAIWKAPAKQFMRQAAYEAGMASTEFPEQLLIALEPEAASIYCRRLRMHQLVPEQPMKRPLQSPSRASAELVNADPAVTELTVDAIPSRPVSGAVLDRPSDETVDNQVQGARYLIVDCGGGTVDITVHELDAAGHITELHRATGGPHGSIGVDAEFERLLCGVFGVDFVEHYKRKYPMGWVHLMTDFESRKRSASPFKNTSLNVSPPFTFINDFKKHKCDPETAVKRYGDPEIEWSPQGMLRLTPVAMKKLFLPTVSQIKQAVGDVLNHPNARDLKYLFLVGGFAESPILQHEMRTEFGNLIKILIPQEVSLAILKGAVLFGIDPSVVHVRRSRLTYGVGILNRFDPKRHPPSKRVRRDGVDWCTDIFDKYVETDQPVMLGNTVVRSYTPAKAGQISIVLNVYSSVNPNVKFITDPGVSRCGTLCLSLPVLDEDMGGATGGKPRPPREIQTRMSFGDTEINVVAIDVVTGRVVKASVDFLGR